MRRILTWVSILVTLLVAGRAMADLTYTQGVGTTLFDFVCFTTKHCPVHVNVDSTGTEKFTSGNPGNVAAAASSYAAGAGVDGWDLTQGAKADAAWVSGSGSVIALLKNIASGIAAAIPAGTARIGYVSDDPCTQLTKTNIAISTSSGTVQVVVPSGITQVYVCSFSLIAGATAVVNLVGGTGASCTTGTPVAALGSTTAASGMSLAANGGLTFGNGGATVVRTTTAGHGLCLIQSGTAALAGNITYVQQ